MDEHKIRRNGSIGHEQGTAIFNLADYQLSAEQVAFQYPQYKRGLSPTTLRIKQGELVLITGASGSGKSTLIRCLVGLIPHLYYGEMSGEVWVGDLRTVETPLWQLTEQIGLVFQNPATQMLALTVEDELLFGLENLGVARTEMAARLEEVLTQFDLHELRHRSPQTLSGGEQQKVALAAIIARKPAILLLDEPFAMLDSTAAAELVAHIAALSAGGVTVVISEHRAEYLQSLPGLRHIHLNAVPASQEASDKRHDGVDEAIHTSSTNHNSIPPLTALTAAAAPLVVQGLTVELGGRAILDQIDFTVAPGELVAIVGRNGVGKTTLLRTLAGLQPYAGEITVGDKSAELGLVFQNADLALFNPTVRDEILYRIATPEWEHYAMLLDLLGLRRYEETPPLLLSEGEKKRVALATMLMQGKRDGLLLDEPSLGQDQKHKSKLTKLIRAVCGAGQFVLFTTHDLTLAAQADRLILLGRDGIVVDGPPQEVFHQSDLWSKIGLQIPTWFWSHDTIKERL